MVLSLLNRGIFVALPLVSRSCLPKNATRFLTGLSHKPCFTGCSFKQQAITNSFLPYKTQVAEGFSGMMWSRNIVLFSKKKGKRKTVKAVAKRFKRTGSGALKYWRAGKNHKMIVKSARARRKLRKPRYVNKTQLKTLNKMLSGI